MSTLHDILRDLDTTTMSTEEIFDHCTDAVPGCSVEEIAQALHEVGHEHMAHAEQLRKFKAGRDARP